VEVAKITSKGQITIPISIRRKLEINEGDKVLFIYKPDGVLMVNPTTFQGGHGDDVVDVAETEMAAEAAAAMKKRQSGKPSKVEVAEDPVVADDAVAASVDEVAALVDEVADDALEPAAESAVESAAESAAESASGEVRRPVPPPVEEPEKPETHVGGVNLSSLLDDIRSIGSNI